jgi:hypothetical protein
MAGFRILAPLGTIFFPPPFSLVRISYKIVKEYLIHQYTIVTSGQILKICKGSMEYPPERGGPGLLPQKFLKI